MLVGSPAPGVAADWHRALNVAAAKLAVAVGVAPAEVRRASGLRRVEIRRTPSQVLRQVTALAHAGVLTAEQIPNELINGAETAEKILSGLSVDELGSQYLAVCERARRCERQHLYFDHTEQFNREFNAIVDEFFRCKKKLKELDEEYEVVGERLNAIANKVTDSTSWPARSKRLEQVDEFVRRRDSLRALFAATCKQTDAVMDQYRRHQAKRVYYHSRRVPEYRDEALVFIPSSTLRKMMVCPFEELGAGPAVRDTALRLMREWNGYCEEFAIEKRVLLQQHKNNEHRDQSLRALIAQSGGAAALEKRLRPVGDTEMKREWIVHPNRSEVGEDESGRNGQYRAISQPRPPATEPFLARVELPRTLSHLADQDGTVTFGGFDWRFVVGAARTFARVHTDVDVPPPFGFKRNGAWQWWDGSTSSDSIVEGAGAAEHVRRYLQRLYPCSTIELAIRAPN